MKQKTIFGLIIFTIIFVIPLLSADCPVGYICGGTDIVVNIAGGMFCTDDGENWIDFSVSPAQNNPTTGLGNCYESSAVGDNFCCPAGSECAPTGEMGPEGELYNCIYTDKNFCWKLETEEDCTNYTKWVAVNSIESHKGEGYCGIDDTSVAYISGEWCWDEVDCSCKWDGANNKCTALDNSTAQCELTGTQSAIGGECTYTMETWQDNCELDGFIYASWTVIGTGDYALGGTRESECQDTGVITIPCEKIVKLDFFTWLNVIVVILILVLIYYSYIKVKNEKKK